MLRGDILLNRDRDRHLLLFVAIAHHAHYTDAVMITAARTYAKMALKLSIMPR